MNAPLFKAVVEKCTTGFFPRNDTKSLSQGEVRGTVKLSDLLESVQSTLYIPGDRPAVST